MLYIPGSRPSWVENAPDRYDADGFVFDLEDSVAPDEKANARETLRDAIPDVGSRDVGVLVRVNPAESGDMEDDLDAVVREGLDAVIVPKLSTAQEVTDVAAIVQYLETRRGLGSRVELVLVPETAYGMYNTYDLCSASGRVAAVVAGSAPGADVNRALGFDWSPEGTETLYLRSKVIMEGRAAGLDQLYGGVWVNIEDLEGLRNELELLSQLGYTGYQAIHPDHIEIVNEVFSPNPEEVAYYERLVETMEETAQESGQGAVRFEGEMIDVAHLKTAERVLERAEAFDVEPADTNQE